MDSIYLTPTATEDYAVLTDRNVRLIDQRDPIGDERLRIGEPENTLGIGELVHPHSISGRCTRNAEGAADILESALREACKYLAKWDEAGAGSNENHGQGGSGFNRPVAVVLSNYGAGLYCVRSDHRVKYFPRS